MVDVRPFLGVRYDRPLGPDLSTLTCPPYDVITAGERVELLRRHPGNIVRLELPQPAEPGGDPYQRAAEKYRAWLADGTLKVDDVPAIYAYHQEFIWEGERRARRGMIVALRLESPASRLVRPHERTLPGPKQDRLQLMRACRANFSPIWCIYDDPVGATDALWRQVEGHEPEAYAVDSDAVRHSVWAVTERPVLAQVHVALARVPVYIADGHHRYETARYFQTEASEGQTLGSDAGANFAMAYLVERSDPGLVVFGTHRLLDRPDGGHADAASVREALGRWFDLSDGPDEAAALLEAVRQGADRPAFGVWYPEAGLSAVARLKGEGLVPEAQAAGHSEPWRRLDVAALHSLFIDQLWPNGAASLAEAGRLVYTRSLAEVETAVRSGEWKLAILVRPTPVEQVIQVADAEDLLPEKSTYFYPKPLTGLVLAQLDGAVPSPDEVTRQRE